MASPTHQPSLYHPWYCKFSKERLAFSEEELIFKKKYSSGQIDYIEILFEKP